METNKVPTAEEWLLNHKDLSIYDVENHDEGGYLGVNKEAVYKIMIEFAKIHVKAALEAALEDAPYGSSTDTVSYKDMKDAILNSYNYDNIK